MTNSTLTDAQHRALHEVTGEPCMDAREQRGRGLRKQAFGGGLMFALDLIEARARQ
jgi:hypothetical protein